MPKALYAMLAIPDPGLRSIFRREIVSTTYGNPVIREFADWGKALEYVNTTSDSLSLAIVDLHMSVEPRNSYGLRVLELARGRFGHGCYKVVVSASYTSRMELSDVGEHPFDYFLSTRFTDEDPVENLRKAIEIARGRTSSREPVLPPSVNQVEVGA